MRSTKFTLSEMYLWNQAILEVACKAIPMDEVDFYMRWLESLWSPEDWSRAS